MKDLFIFDIGEINISKTTADELREKILFVARQNNIGDNPIQYELLLKNIKSRMSELSENIDFIFNGSRVDFNLENSVIFTTRVLKTIFLDKKESELITLQIKNLDILSFYAYGKAWTKKVTSYESLQKNNNSDFKNIREIKKTNRLKIFKWSLISLCFILCVLTIISLIILLKNESKRNQISEDEYQSVIKYLYNPEMIAKEKFDKNNYDTLKIPERSIIFKSKFDDIVNTFNENKTYSVDGVKIEQIFEKDTFDVQPGIKYCKSYDKMAFGFGRSYRLSDCYTRNVSYDKQKYMCILRISFKDSTYVSYISFNWAEIGNNWGSTGNVHINGESKYLGFYPYQTLGIYPTSNKIKDEEIRPYRCKIDRNVKFIDIAVWDISYESEIFVNDIILLGN